MSTTTNQGLIVADPSDVNDVPASFTELLSGGVTPSAGLESRLVQRYLSAVDRTARNPTPNEGELSYLADTNIYEFYDGAAWALLVKGYITDSTRVVNSAGVTTTETVIDSVTFTAVAGQRYKLTWNSNIRSSVVNDTGRVIFRWTPGAVASTAGTLFYSAQFQISAIIVGNSHSFCMIDTVTGITAGQTTIGVSIIRDTGSGTLTSIGNANWQNITLLESV
jgi:hypothetical protein